MTSPGANQRSFGLALDGGVVSNMTRKIERKMLKEKRELGVYTLNASAQREALLSLRAERAGRRLVLLIDIYLFHIHAPCKAGKNLS